MSPVTTTCRTVCAGDTGRDGEGRTVLHAHIHLGFRHAHRETKDRLTNLGSQGRRGNAAIIILNKKIKKPKTFERICEQFRQAAKLMFVRLFMFKKSNTFFERWHKCLKSDSRPK